MQLFQIWVRGRNPKYLGQCAGHSFEDAIAKFVKTSDKHRDDIDIKAITYKGNSLFSTAKEAAAA